ncbi:MAG: P-loop NTPase fold protein [Henriciella sp.]
MAETERKKFARLIRDEPAEHDQFSGEGHERTARSLALAINELSEDDGAIGLDGEWGAGKSSVIRLTERIIKTSNETKLKYHFFCFDLWLHQPKLLKLAFLEELIGWLENKDLISTKTAATYSKQLSDRRVETTVENSRQYKLSAIFFILAFPLLPLVYMWLSPFAFATSPDPHWIIPILQKIALYALPILYVVFVFAFLASLLRKDVNDPLAALSAATRLFSRETDQDSFTQHVNERSPTGEEFQNFFRELLSVAQKKNDRIILVLDNIDRLPIRNFFEVWSEARSIFAARNRGAKLPQSAVTAVIPFDSAYISEAFQKENQSDHESAIKNAQSLVAKSFDLTMRVAPPVATDWKNYLFDKLDWSLPINLPEAERLKVHRLFDIRLQDEKKHATPRSLNTYVNEIGTIWNQWQDDIPVAHIALYILNRSRIEQNPSVLQSTSIIDRRQARIVDGDWHRNMVALAFNVDPQHAYQVLLGQDIAKSIEEYEFGEFERLSKLPGFWEVLPDLIERNAESWAQNRGYSLAIAGEFLAHDQFNERHLVETWAHLDEAIPFLDKCDSEDANYYTGLAEILGHSPAEELTERTRAVISWYSSGLPEIEDRTHETGRNWVTFVGYATQAIVRQNANAAKLLFRQIVFPDGQKFAIGVFAKSRELSDVSASSFKMRHSDEELATASLELVTSAPDVVARAIDSAPKFAKQAFLQTCLDRLCNRLHSEKLSPAALEGLLKLSKSVIANASDQNPLIARIKQQYDDGSLLWHLDRTADSKNPVVTAHLLWLIAKTGNGNLSPQLPTNHPHFGDISQLVPRVAVLISNYDDEHEVIRELSGLIATADGFAEWMTFTLADASQPPLVPTFRRLVLDANFNRLSISDVMTRFFEIEELLDDNLVTKFLRKFANWSEKFDDHIGGSDSLKVAPRLVEAIHEYGVEGLDKIPAALDSYYGAFDESDWEQFFQEEDSSAMTHLFIRLSQGYRPPVGPFRAAVSQHALGVLDGTEIVTKTASSWKKLLSGMQKNTKQKVAKDTFINLKEVTTTPDSVEHFTELYFELGAMLPLESSPELALDQLLTPLVASTSETARSFIREKSKEFVACKKVASPEAVDRFEEAVLTCRNSADEAIASWAQELFTNFEIVIPVQQVDQERPS